MLPLTVETIAAVVGGRLCDVPNPQVLVTGPAVLDSRLVVPGGLFAAFDGERVDGHEFAGAAVAAGAAVVLASRPVGVPAVVVEDVQAALGRLARRVLDGLPDAVVIGVTGSAGKTSTKDLLAQVLGAYAPTVATAGSFNNELGLPVTVTHTDAGTRYLVLEMGARGRGHIAYLTGIAPPRVGLVTNVGSAHAGEFGGGRESIAEAKGELVEALPADGFAVLNADDDLVVAMAARTSAKVVTFGRSAMATLRAVDVVLDERARPRFTLITPDGTAPVVLALVGEHHVSNALAAAAVAYAVGVPLDVTAAALSGAEALSAGRMQVNDRPDGVTVINDAYNANPESMTAALAAMTRLAGDRRKVAVLGTMHELGADSPARHAELGTAAAGCADVVIAVGPGDAPAIAAAARAAGSATAQHVPDVPAARIVLDAVVRPGDVVLVKASNSVGLQVLARQLLQPHD